MSKLQDLIQELCPNGVEYKKLGDVCKVLRGKRLTTRDLSENAKFPVFHGGIEPIGYYEENNRVANSAMVINVGASAGTVGFSEKEFWSSDGCFCFTQNDLINQKFLYYYLQTMENSIKSKVRKAGIPTLDNKDVEKITIPLPPLPVQEEIVKILDRFAVYTAELQAELQARKEQYEYYRNLLLNFNHAYGAADDQQKKSVTTWGGHSYEIQWKTLGEICVNICSGGTPSTSRKDYYEGTIPWLRTQEVDWKDVYDTEIKISEEAIANSSAKLIPANCVIVAMYGATAAKSCINRIPLSTNQACCNLQVKEDIAIHKYVYHWLCHEYINLKSLGEGSQSNLNGKKIKNYPIPIPPLELQERIVAILDKFETLVNDLSQGLPAEIAAVQEQYEYYRNKLLTFKQVA